MSRCAPDLPSADSNPVERFERLNRASVALLDPLFEPSSQTAPRQTAVRLAEAILACAQEADRLGLPGLSQVSGWLSPYLRREVDALEWGAVREHVEGWVGQVIAFCAGQSSPEEAAQLVHRPQDWPGVARMPPAVVDIMASQLQADALRVIALATQALEVEERRAAIPAQEAASDERALEQEPAAASETASAGVITVAEDELGMLCEAVDGLIDEVVAPLERLPQPLQATAREEFTELADVCRERLGNLCDALDYVGLSVLAVELQRCRQALADWRDDPEPSTASMPALLRAMIEAVSAFLRRPHTAAVARLAAVLADERWPVRNSNAAAALEALRSLQLVGSRQVRAAVAPLDQEDVSLQIPDEADRSVVDTLLRELPMLSAELGERIEHLVTGGSTTITLGGTVDDSVTPTPAREGLTTSEEDLIAAQRIAHTLKGVANTVGVRGIANLTHRLEDLLQLLAAPGVTIDPPLRQVLGDAADCLAEMSDAVAGLGPGPRDAVGLCAALDDAIQRCLGGDPIVAVPGAPALEPTREPASELLLEPVPEAAPEPAPLAQRISEVAPALEPVLVGAEPLSSLEFEPRGDDEMLRVPARVLDRMLALASEATIMLAQVQEQVARLGDVRHAFRVDADRLRDLGGELDRLVELRGVSLGERRGRDDFDPLEFDDFDELHTVSRRIGEAGADARVLDQQLDRQGATLSEVVGQLDRVQTDLREALMHSRMVPVRTMAGRLQRAVRQAARATGKQVELVLSGEDTPIDAQLLHELVEPLAHLLRNAVDHGIESAQERAQAGKPVVGRIRLEFNRDGHRLSIRCHDDGRGLDLDAVHSRAVAMELLAPGTQLASPVLARLILEPGFTTREQATQLSGRGIGMDVVHQAVLGLRGELEISPNPGQGMEIRIALPQGMSAIPVVVARTPSHVLALSIRGAERILPADGVIADDQGRVHFVCDQGRLPALRLDEMLGLPAGYFLREAEAARLSMGRSVAARWGGDGEVALLVRRSNGDLIAVIAPGLGQTRSVVVRPLPSWLPPIRAVEGAAVLGDGAVATVLDLPRLVELDAPLAATSWIDRPRPQRPVCLVADDSVSVRRSMELFLNDLGFEVDTAGDGIEALALVQRRVPALVIVDLEMPRMNGIELSRALRSDPRTRRLPLIMITSRSSERHRGLAREAGVDAFLTKPYAEDDLAAEIHRRLVAEPAVG